jgi:hypothetical protein
MMESEVNVNMRRSIRVEKEGRRNDRPDFSAGAPPPLRTFLFVDE